jgi:hypothetical protein
LLLIILYERGRNIHDRRIASTGQDYSQTKQRNSKSISLRTANSQQLTAKKQAEEEKRRRKSKRASKQQ